MRWRGREQSQNVEDRRGMGPAAAGGIGGGGLLIAVVLYFLVGPDRAQQFIQQNKGAAQQQQQANAGGGGQDDDAKEFVSVVLRDTERVWSRIFETRLTEKYSQPKLVLFNNAVASDCGRATSAVGPFYCPADRQIYIDPGFFNELAKRHNAPGDFANAYVIAHEVAHHVQNLMGFSDIVNKVRRRGNEIETNRATVRLELQADFLAGVWAHHAQRNYKILEDGDIDEAINAATQIGDDTLQMKASGRVVPERFTHGTSEQRVRWFKKGIVSGDLAECQRLFEMDYNDL